MQHGPTEPR